MNATPINQTSAEADIVIASYEEIEMYGTPLDEQEARWNAAIAIAVLTELFERLREKMLRG